MEKRNDGSHGKTAEELIAEDAGRDNRSNPDSYKSAADYEGDEGDLDAEDIENLDDDYLDNDDLEDIDYEDDDDVSTDRDV